MTMISGCKKTVMMSVNRPSSRWLSEDNAKILVLMCLLFSPLDDNGHLLINAFDATHAFYELQQSLQTQNWKLSLKDHRPDDFLPFFDVHNLTAAIDHIETIYNINKLPAFTETAMDIIKIIQKVLDGTILQSKTYADLPKQ